MQPRTYNRRTNPDIFRYITLAITALVLLAYLFAPSGRTLISGDIQVSPQQTTQIQPIELKRQLIGALSIDVTAQIPSNQWLTYEIQLTDNQGKILASGLKQAWYETGTWYEEGESGSWQENDLQAGLDVRAQQPEPVTIGLAVLDYTDTSGKDINQPVSFNLNVRNGVVDTRYLWPGIIGTIILTWLSFKATPGSILTKIFAVLVVLIAIVTITQCFTPQSALVLRQENQQNYWARSGTELSGNYTRGIWIPLPSVRQSYEEFQGGGPGAGK
jgi:preprotein translocase subunit Sec61beta